MRILFVEDDAAIAAGLTYSLQREGYEVAMAASVRQALHHLETSDCDLGIIDLGLPDGSGFTICRQMKQMGRPVIFLSAVDDETTVVQGLDLGGDDYVTKPFRLQELLSRIRSVIRRYEPGSHSIVQIDDLTIDQKQAKVFRDQQEIFLSAMEYQLLMVFVHHPGQTLSRTQLLDALWDHKGQYVEDNTLSVTIRRLREKIERDPQTPRILMTVRGLGYRMEVDHES